MNSCLYHGTLRHRRLAPKAHHFTYSVFMAGSIWMSWTRCPLSACVVTALRPRHFMMRITRWARRSKRVSLSVWKI